MAYRTLTAAQAARRGYRVSGGWTAGELADLDNGGVFHSFGRVHGVEVFGSAALRREADGSVARVAADGQVVARYASDLPLRILVR